jgi:hypothetical protein
LTLCPPHPSFGLGASRCDKTCQQLLDEARNASSGSSESRTPAPPSTLSRSAVPSGKPWTRSLRQRS